LPSNSQQKLDGAIYGSYYKFLANTVVVKLPGQWDSPISQAAVGVVVDTFCGNFQLSTSLCVQRTNCAHMVHHSHQLTENWEFNGGTLLSDHKALHFLQIGVCVDYRWWQLFNTMTMHRSTKWGAIPYEESTVGIQSIRVVPGCLPAAVLTMQYPQYMAMRNPSQAHHILVGASPGTFIILWLSQCLLVDLQLWHWILTCLLEAKRSTPED
jgi:hypothetical protein